MTKRDEPIRVAVVGGGCGALTAAFALTDPKLQGAYEVTVYQAGWRLGGKGASGRGPAQRIEEHGLHMWLGFYENAFRLMRACYDELGRDPNQCRIANWQDAFKPHPFIGVSEQAHGFPDAVWRIATPINEVLPGEPVDVYEPPTLLDYLRQMLRLLGTLIAEAGADTQSSAADMPEEANSDALVALLDRYSRVADTLSLTAAWHLIGWLETVVSVADLPTRPLGSLLDLVRSNVLARLASAAQEDATARHVWCWIDVIAACAVGLVTGGVLNDEQGLDSLQDHEFRQWLKDHGASDESVNSGFMQAMYSMVFAYGQGDASDPQLDAGQAIRSGLRAIFGYKGAFFWRMQSGMGDIVFAPLYEVLRRRGVRFEFFHRLVNVGLTEKRRRVRTLEFEVQAKMKDGKPYQPLIDVDGLPCWPSQPRYEQLVDGDAAQIDGRDYECFWKRHVDHLKTIKLGRDFDLVVLGVGLGEVEHVCQEILAHDGAWQDMVTNLGTVGTQAFQIWMREDMRSLGWAEDQCTVSGFEEPFDTWADMRHLLREEHWGEEAPRSIAYFCNALPEARIDHGKDVPSYWREQAKQNAIGFLEQKVHFLWPDAVDGKGRFRWEVLSSPPAELDAEDRGSGRFDSQYWTANVNPSDRYAQSLPGTARYRISPLDVSYRNLTIAGDWTDCGFNHGCVEAAVMSGLLAAHALSGSPSLESIVGWDHP